MLFAALGAMTWAIRGCSGFGGMDGCMFAGVTWGTAWWFIARQPTEALSRRYCSAWIILALTIGIGVSGNRGWMQWPSFFEGHLQTNTAEGRFVSIPRVYGFIWLFLAGVPWAGLGACLLSWCGGRTRPGDWILRLSCGFGAAFLARILFDQLPHVFLPLYSTMQSQYADLQANPNLRRLINDNRAAITHLGLYLGFLVCEAIRRDWKNVVLITTVGLVNGIGWAVCQNWRWAPRLWPQAHFNWWRCWESCGGISIGLAYGLAYYLANRPVAAQLVSSSSSKAPHGCPNLERLGAGLALIFGLGMSVKNGLKGWANIYLGNENYWNMVFWSVIGPLMILAVVGLLVWLRLRLLPVGFKDEVFPYAYRMVWLVLVVQNIIAQMVTGPPSSWNEMAFSIYYILLFLLSAVIVYHFRCRQLQRGTAKLETKV